MTDIARTTAADHGVVLSPDPSAELRLAGVTHDGLVLIHDQATPDRVTGYDPATLEAVGTITLPGPAISAWIEGDRTTWIEASGQLHIGDVTVPGTYRWARQ